jgi:hypothetical protein
MKLRCFWGTVLPTYGTFEMLADLCDEVEDVDVLALVAGHLVTEDGDQVLQVTLTHVSTTPYNQTVEH